MTKHYFWAAITACLLSTSAIGQTLKAPFTFNKNDKLPKTVEKFLCSNSGKKFNAADFNSILSKKVAYSNANNNNIISTTILSEDFSLWTAGSETAPDTDDMTTDSTKLQKYMSTPGGWSGYMAYQAGEMAYLGYNEEDGPGYLKTMPINLSTSQGIYKVTMRAKSVNKNAEQQMMQIFSFDEDAMSIINAKAVEFGTEWTELEWILAGGRKSTSIMFYPNSGKALVDNLKIEDLTYPLNNPQNVSAQMEDINRIKVTWQAVDKASSYYVYAINSDTDKKEAETTVNTNSATLDFIPQGDVYYNIYVVAKNGNDESYPGGYTTKFAPSAVGNAKALAATNITDAGFTANWERATNAAKHIVAVNQTHVATTDGEEFVLFNDDFSSLNDVTMDNPVVVAQLGYCDKYFKRSGWYGDVVAGLQGMVAMTNMYAGYGMPGSITSPVLDLSVGEGKTTVSGTVSSMADDAVMSVAYIINGNKVDEQLVDVTTAGGTFNVTLSGGKDNAQIYLSIYDATPEGDFIFLDNIKITTTMNKGEVIKLPYTTFYVDYPATSVNVDIPLAGSDNAWYTVQGYFSDDMAGKVSDPVTVKEITDGINQKSAGNSASVSFDGNTIGISNPAGCNIAIFGMDGKEVAHSTEGKTSVQINLPKGGYIIRIGNQSFKIIK